MEHRILEADNSNGRVQPPRPRRTDSSRTRTIAVLVLLGLIATVAPAGAADVDLVAGVLSYTDAFPNPTPVANDLTVSLASGVYTLDDPAEAAITISAGALAQGCAPFDSNTVTCPAAAITTFFISTRDGNDHVVVTGATVPAIVSGGRGNDVLVGGQSDDTFPWNPGDGSDTIDGGPGHDTLAFNGANISEHFTILADFQDFVLLRDVAAIQIIATNTEALTLRTLGGTDTVDTTVLATTAQDIVDGLFDGSDDGLPDVLRVDATGLCPTRQGDTFETEGRQPIHFVNIPQVFVNNTVCPIDPCDGAVPTQGCTVNHVRNQPCQGTDGDDVITGTKGGDVILGGGGHDRIRGGAGDDLLCGGEGDDTLTGGAGADTLRGGNGNDLLSGGAGDDDLDGGRGDDRLRGAGGADTLQGGIGIDRVDGGSGDDRCSDTDEAGPFPRCEP